MPTLEERLDALEYRVLTLETHAKSTPDEPRAEDLVQALREELAPEPEPDMRFQPEVRQEIALRTTPVYDPTKTYVEGESVQHGGRLWVALPDVAVGYAPDDNYNLADRVGGWMPL